MKAPRGRIKSSRASLIGGIAVGTASFALWMAIAYDFGAASTSCLALGLVVSAVVAAWIRIADL